MELIILEKEKEIIPKKRYDYNFLINDTHQKNITLLKDYSNEKICKNTYIEGICSSTDCKNNFIKKIIETVNTGYYCKECGKKNGIIKRKETCLKKYGTEICLKNPIVKEKMKQTNMLKYGTEYSFQSEIVKNKIKKTNNERYGVNNPTQNKEIKEKVNNTMIKLYGTKNPLQNKELNNKAKKSFLNNFGVDNPSKSEIIKNKKRETCKKNWGVEYPNQNQINKQKCVDTSLLNWGVEYPIQNEEIASKITKSCYKKRNYLFPSGRQDEVQGYEPFALDELLFVELIEENDIITGCENVPEIWYKDENNKLHRHYVDIFISTQNRCIEVKSTWTATKNKHNIFLKQESAKEKGYNYEIWIYNSKGNIVEKHL